MKITRLTLVHFETFLIVKTTLIVALNFQMKFKVVPTSEPAVFIALFQPHDINQ